MSVVKPCHEVISGQASVTAIQYNKRRSWVLQVLHKECALGENEYVRIPVDHLGIRKAYSNSRFNLTDNVIVLLPGFLIIKLKITV